jgi:DNA-binding HxlR family transcriptional regulator
LLFKGKRSFSELLKSEERISTNILANRLKTLCDQDILSKSGDGKSVSYGLTEKGVDLAPMMVEMILWSARYDENTATPEEFVRAAELNRDELLASIREGAARAQ